jgi:hypothetical protein
VFVDRTRLRRAALRYVEHGWAVTPGACLAGNRFVCGRPGCPIMGCHPALEAWEQSASTDVARIATWWRRRPHTVLLATGVAFDVLEVPAALGLRALGAARLRAGIIGPSPEVHGSSPGLSPEVQGSSPGPGVHGSVHGGVHGPVAAVPGGRWMFLVRPGEPLRRELECCLDVVRHGPGSWIPAPPSRMPEGPVRWAVSPEETQWTLPASAPVQAMLVDALGARGRKVRQPVVPRQVSTARRAA